MLRNKHENKIDMLHGSLLDKILIFSIPLALSMMLQQLFNSADVAVVGRFDSPQAMAAVGSNGAAINLFVNLFVGLSIGTNVLVANLIGVGAKEKIHDAVHTSIFMALISGIFLLLAGIIVARPLLTIMNTPDDIMELAVLYFRIYFTGMPFIMVYNFASAVLRSMGDSKRPLLCLAVGGVVNVILNLILVIGFKMGVSGVAIATVISNVISSFMSMNYLMKETEPFTFRFRDLVLKKEYVIPMLKIGLPAGLQGMLFSISNVTIQTAINGLGSYASAGSAAALNYDFFTYYVCAAFTQAVVTFTSQNFGAKNYERCRKVYRLTMMSALFFNGLVCLGCYVFRDFLISFFTNDPEVMKYGNIRMIYAVSFLWMCNLYEISGGALRGMGHSTLPAVIILLGCCVLRIVWVYSVFQIYGTFEILMLVYPVSWLVTAIVTLFMYYRIRRNF